MEDMQEKRHLSLVHWILNVSDFLYIHPRPRQTRKNSIHFIHSYCLYFGSFVHVFLHFIIFIVILSHSNQSFIIATPSTKQRGFGHALIVGLARSPRIITKNMNKKKVNSRYRVHPFIKVVNYNHMMPTRYSFDLDVKGFITSEAIIDPAKRKEACSVLAKKLEERYRLGHNKWFFQKLKF